MRVLQAPSEIAGQTSILARALREIGVEAWSLATNATFAQYAIDEHTLDDTRSALPRYTGYLRNLAKHLGRWDVFHFHFGRTLVPPHNPDAALYHMLGRKVVYHYHGCDVRSRALMMERHDRSTCTECQPFCIPKRQQRVLAEARRHADAQIVSTPDLLESVPDATQVHVAAWLPDYPWQPAREQPRLVLHAPTDRRIKGTRFVEAAFAALRPRFPDVRFEIVERLPWRELRDLMAQCDILVDQTNMGWYGMVSVEAMALGRPALAWIRDDFDSLARGCPVVRITADDLTESIASLLADAPRRRELAEAGRAWVEQEHDAHVIARRLVGIYQSIGAR